MPVLDLTTLYQTGLGGTELYWAVLGCAGLYWVVLGSPGLYLTLPDWTGLHWDLIVCGDHWSGWFKWSR